MPEFSGPSTFTPFLRRFTDERARDLGDTKALYNRVRSLHHASPLSAEDARIDVGGDIYAACVPLSEPLHPILIRAIDEILRLEKPIFQCPEIDFSNVVLSLKESVDLRHFLRSKEHFHAQEQKVVPLLKQCLANTFNYITEQLPADLCSVSVHHSGHLYASGPKAGSRRYPGRV